MFNTLRKFLQILTPDERRKLWIIWAVMVVVALFEVIGVGSITPFLGVASDPSVIQRQPILSWAYDALGFSSVQQFLVVLGILVAVFVAARNALMALNYYVFTRYSKMRNFTVSRRLLATYLNSPYAYFLGKNSAELSRNILSEVQQLISGFLLPLLQGVSRLIVAVFLVGFLVALNPMIAGFVALVMGGVYGIIYLIVKRRLNTLGALRLQANRERYMVTSDAFAGIKDTKLLGKERSFVRQYTDPARNMARHEATRDVIAQMPKHILEAIAFSGLVLIMVYLIATTENFQSVVPLVGVYAFAGYRLMPAMQVIFQSLAKARAHRAVVDFLFDDLQGAEPVRVGKNRRDERHPTQLPLQHNIELADCTYRYPGAAAPVLDGLNLTIPANTTVGFVGATGSGKTTLIDVILALLEPETGRLLVDGVPVTDTNRRNWQANIGYVPQHIYLSDKTIRENIAFGVSPEDIDETRVRRAAETANLHEFVAHELPHGYDTVVGERGIRLSGGQRQRVGIARALYNDPAVLALDEATSALDTITEDAVMEAISSLSHQKTILLIAHRITTVQNCDQIYLLESGHISDSGTYDELIRRNTRFRQLAKVLE